MRIRPRVMALAVAACVLTPVAFADSALAHGGREHFRRHDVFRSTQAKGVCAQAGVAVNGHVRGMNWYRNGAENSVSSLTETQTNELKAACEKLATAYGVKRKAQEAAFKTLWEALKADRTKLDEACPALTEHHERGWWQTEISPACKEALQAYWTAAHEAGKAYRAVREETCKRFSAALTEFETATGPILATLEAAQTEHRFHPGQGSGVPGQGYGDPGQGYGGPGHDSGGPGQDGHWHHH